MTEAHRLTGIHMADAESLSDSENTDGEEIADTGFTTHLHNGMQQATEPMLVKGKDPGDGGVRLYDVVEAVTDGKSPRKRKSLKKTVKTAKEILVEFCADTSIQGLKQIAEPQPFVARR